MQRKLFKSSLIFSLMTLVSRVLGFIRDIAIAYAFGASAGYDAFVVAFRLPNLLRRLFAEGAFSQAFVPTMAEYRTNSGKDELKLFLGKVLGNLTVVLVIITILGVIGANGLVNLFAPGLDEPNQTSYAAQLLRINFPYILFISLTAYSAGILNSYGKYAVPAITPVLLNICMIVAAIYFAPKMLNKELSLSYAVLFAGILQFAFQIPFLLQMNMLPKPAIDWQDTGVRKMLKLMAPAILGGSVGQINILIDTIFASFLPVGSISWLYYSDRLMEFPLGVFGVGLSTIILPPLSEQHCLGSDKEFSRTIDWAVRMVLSIGIPAMIGLYLLAAPIMSTLFKSGKFSQIDVIMSTHSLMAYALAVVGIMLTKVFASAFFAKQNPSTPVKIAVLCLLINLALNFSLIKPLAHAGLALATSLASLCNAGLLCYVLVKDKTYTLQPDWWSFLAKLLIANLCLSVILYFATPDLSYWLVAARPMKVSILSGLIIGGALGYILVLLLVKFDFKRLLAKSV